MKRELDEEVITFGQESVPNIASQLNPEDLDDLLLILSADRDGLITFWDDMMSEEHKYFSNKSTKDTNRRPYVREIEPEYNTHPDLGNCYVAFIRGIPQMTDQVRLRVIIPELDEYNNPIARKSKYKMKEVIVGATRNTKVELHHIALYVAMIKNHLLSKSDQPSDDFDEDLENIYQSFLTMKKKQTDKQESLIVIHRCGNHWCGNWKHLSVASKRINDNQVHCHYFIQSRRSAQEAIEFINNYCPPYSVDAMYRMCI